MKKTLFVLLFFALIFSTEGLFASGMDENPNQSVNYIRTSKRNAATDAADAAFYNPAGTVKLADGMHLNVGTQYVVRKHEHEAAGTTYTDEGPVFFPNLHMVWKQKNWAAFYSFTIPGGGGWSDFKDGTSTSMYLTQMYAAAILMGGPWFPKESTQKGFSYYIANSLGAAYAVNDIISIGAVGRYIFAMKQYEMELTATNLTVDSTSKEKGEDRAHGFAPIFSINISPTKELNIGLKYQMKTTLEFETDIKKGQILASTDGQKYRRDLPAQASIGISYRIIPTLMVEVDANYFFTKDAAWNGEQRKWDNAYDAGFAVEYTIIPQLKASVGFGYSWQNAKGDDANDSSERYANPYLDVWAISGGLGYAVMPELTINAGLIRSFFKDETTAQNIKVKRETWLVGLGVDYKVL